MAAAFSWQALAGAASSAPLPPRTALLASPAVCSSQHGKLWGSVCASTGTGRRACALVRAHSETDVAVSRAACPAVKPQVDAAAFAALDLRVGLIIDAKPVEDVAMSAKRGKPTQSRTYLQLTVDIGCEVRTVVSECRYVMDVEDAVGKKVIFVANVPPTDVLGVRSHGFILTGYNYDPTPMPRSFKLILPGLGKLPPGSQLLEATVPS